MKAISLMYHDIISNDNFDESGFVGSSSAIYKIEIGEARSQFDRLELVSNFFPTSVLDCPHVCAIDDVFQFLTFDDGGVSAHTFCRDLLERRGWVGHFFVTADKIGDKRFLSSNQIRDLRSQGHVVGSHSWSHPARLSSCSRDKIAAEWRDSVLRLSDILQERVVTASVPGGYYSAEVAQCASDAGIRYLFTSEPVIKVHAVDQCQVLGRFAVTNSMTSSYICGLAKRGGSPQRIKQFLFWNFKKVLKFGLGDVYLKLRKSIL